MVERNEQDNKIPNMNEKYKYQDDIEFLRRITEILQPVIDHYNDTQKVILELQKHSKDIIKFIEASFVEICNRGK